MSPEPWPAAARELPPMPAEPRKTAAGPAVDGPANITPAESSAAPDVQRQPTPTPAAPPEESLRALDKRTVALVMLSLVASLTAVALVMASVVSRWPSPSATPSRIKSAHEVSQMEAWVAANLPARTRLTAQDAIASQMRDAGLATRNILPYEYLRPDVNGTAAVGGWHNVKYLVATELTRRVGAILPQVEQMLRASIPVAIFGRAAERIEVRRILPGGTAGVADRWAMDGAARREAEGGLLVNPRLRVAASARAVLAAGGLDLRAATALVMIADQTAVRLDAIAVDAAESAAGLPARRITITITKGPRVADALRALPVEYRPTGLQAPAAGQMQLVWPLAAVPVTPAT
jgi:hypothetical protein